MENTDKSKVGKDKLARNNVDYFRTGSGANLRLCNPTWTFLYELGIQGYHSDERIYVA